MNTIQLVITDSSIGAIFNNSVLTDKRLGVTTSFYETTATASEASSSSLTYDNVLFNVSASKQKNSFKTAFNAKYTMNKTTGEFCSVRALIERNESLSYNLSIDVSYENPTTNTLKSNRYVETNVSQATLSQREVTVDFDSLVASTISNLFVVS